MAVLKELKERSLFKILVAYLAGGWVALEVVDQVTNQAILPDVVYQVTLIWFLCGIPGALIIGWYHGEKGRQRATRTEVALLMGVLVLALTASGGTIGDAMARQLRERAAAESDLDLRHIATLYFDDLTPGKEAQHIADGFSESLMRELATVRELTLVSRNGVAPFRNQDLPRDSIARLLGVGTLVDGRVERVGGDRLRISVRVVDGQSGDVFGRAGFERPMGELLQAQRDLAQEAAVLLRGWLGQEVKLRRTRGNTESVPAWALYQRGEKARKDAEEALDAQDEDAAAAAFDRADDLLAQAELVDPNWPAPTVLRGRIAYRRARIAHENPERLEWIDAGLRHVDRALAIDPAYAEALEVRGTLRYLGHFPEVESDHDKREALFEQAKRDLERAVDLDPTLASAYSILNHLYGRAGDLASMVLAGRRAYEEDAYVENADVILWRTLNSSYNLEQFSEAQRWCREGARRFPDDSRFTECRLMLMTTPAVEPDVDTAWTLLARIDSLAPEHQALWEHLRGELYVAGVLARAGLPDSASAVLARTHDSLSAANDPDRWLYALEAHMRTLLDQDEEAIELLKVYAIANPGIDFSHNWWWRNLRGHERFSEIEVGTADH